MPCRIYALAKDLDIDSKELVEVCRKAGISGKGSALASLTDDEVAKVKAFLRGGDKKSEAGQAPAGTATRRTTPEVYRREDYIAPVTPGKVKVLDVTARRPAPKGEVGRPAEETPPQEVEPPKEKEVVAEPVVVPAAEPAVASPVAPAVAPAVASPAEPAVAPVIEPVLTTPADELPPQDQPAAAIAAQTQAEEQDAAAVESRAEPSREGRWAERRDPKIIHLRGDDKKEPSGAPKLPRKSRQPIIKLAEMPAAKKPPAAPKTPEVKAQKPEIRLTPSAIAGHRAGQKAPLEQLTKDHFAKTQEKKGKPAPPDKDRKKGGKPEPEVVVEAPLSGKGVKRRRADGTEEEVDGKMAGMAAARLDRQKSRKVRARARTETPEGEEEREAAPVRRPKTLVRGTAPARPRRAGKTSSWSCPARSAAFPRRQASARARCSSP